MVNNDVKLRDVENNSSRLKDSALEFDNFGSRLKNRYRYKKYKTIIILSMSILLLLIVFLYVI